MFIETERLIIREFDLSMAKAVHENSLDEDNRKFVPDEVFETEEDARETIEFLIGQYSKEDGPFVYPILTKKNENIGYVQIAPIENGWEIGYHIAKNIPGTDMPRRRFLPFCLLSPKRNRFPPYTEYALRKMLLRQESWKNAASKTYIAA